jgi:imidazolonepropionase-like amidohydrolase
MIALLLSLAGLAADGPDRHLLAPGLADAPCVVLRPAGIATTRVHTPEGTLEGRYVVLLAGGRIEAVSETVPGLGADGTWRGLRCAVVDTAGRTVTPGLVEVASSIGVVEVSLEDGTRDGDAGGEDPIRAALQVGDAYNPRSSVVPITRIEGLTSAVVRPSGGRISGQAAWVDLAGGSQADTVKGDSVAMIASLGGPSRAAALGELREALADAVAYSQNRGAYERNATRELAASRRDLEALLPVARGELPLVVGADRAADIEALLRLRADTGIRLVIDGAAEGWLLADALARAEVPVIVDPLVVGPGSFSQIHARADNAKLLADAGVDVMIATHSSHNARTLRQAAGNAVRGGLSHDEALDAITTVPSRVFGPPTHRGLRKGSVANVVVWDGDPLELSTSATAVFIGGRPIPLDSRQWRLFLRYRTLPGTPAAAVPLPDTP